MTHFLKQAQIQNIMFDHYAIFKSESCKTDTFKNKFDIIGNISFDLE